MEVGMQKTHMKEEHKFLEIYQNNLFRILDLMVHISNMFVTEKS